MSNFNAIKLLREAAREWAGLVSSLGHEDYDEETLHDTADGETNLIELTEGVVQHIVTIENQYLPGIDNRIKLLQARQARYKKTVQGMRANVCAALDLAGIKKAIQYPEFTVGVSRRAPNVVIIDEAAIPSKYWIDADPKLDKKTLKEDLKALAEDPEADEVPGASMDNGSLSLTVRSN